MCEITLAGVNLVMFLYEESTYDALSEVSDELWFFYDMIRHSQLVFPRLLSVRLRKITAPLLVVAWAPRCLGLELSFSVCCLLNFCAGAYLRTSLQFQADV